MKWTAGIFLLLCSCTTGQLIKDVDENQINDLAGYTDVRQIATTNAKRWCPTSDAINPACVLTLTDGSAVLVYTKGDECGLQHELKHLKHGSRHSDNWVFCENR